MSLPLYRCSQDQRLLRRTDIDRGVCLGHQIKLATSGSLLEWIRVLYWKLAGKL
jgi:hypothetical protein